MAMSNLLTTIWQSLRGNTGVGRDFIAVYSELGAILLALILFKTFIQEGLQVSSGHHSELPRILVKYLFVAAMFYVWSQAANSIFSAVQALATWFYPNLDKLLDTMAASMATMEGSQQATANSQGLVSTVVGTLYNFTVGGLFTLIGIVILFLCWGLILVNIAGSLTILAMSLMLGPVFFALSFDREFRGQALNWFSTVLSYFMLIPLYGAALTIAAAVAGASVNSHLFGLPSSGQFLAQIIGPFMAVGVVFSTNKIVNSLVGGAAGSGLGSTVLGVITVAAGLLPGGAMVRSTFSAGRGAIAAAASAGSVVGAKLSSTARAALGKQGE